MEECLNPQTMVLGAKGKGGGFEEFSEKSKWSKI
jgi:hypothetical protein